MFLKTMQKIWKQGNTQIYYLGEIQINKNPSRKSSLQKGDRQWGKKYKSKAIPVTGHESL
jgi:hypothetical protein